MDKWEHDQWYRILIGTTIYTTIIIYIFICLLFVSKISKTCKQVVWIHVRIQIFATFSVIYKCKKCRGLCSHGRVDEMLVYKIK